jgi:hypothetical protein
MEKTDGTLARPGYGLWKEVVFVSIAVENTSSRLTEGETA